LPPSAALTECQFRAWLDSNKTRMGLVIPPRGFGHSKIVECQTRAKSDLEVKYLVPIL
jgi:hypothetical protein